MFGFEKKLKSTYGFYKTVFHCFLDMLVTKFMQTLFDLLNMMSFFFFYQFVLSLILFNFILKSQDACYYLITF